MEDLFEKIYNQAKVEKNGSESPQNLEARLEQDYYRYIRPSTGIDTQTIANGILYEIYRHSNFPITAVYAIKSQLESGINQSDNGKSFSPIGIILQNFGLDTKVYSNIHNHFVAAIEYT
jgi:hypothetical protein